MTKVCIILLCCLALRCKIQWQWKNARMGEVRHYIGSTLVSILAQFWRLERRIHWPKDRWSNLPRATLQQYDEAYCHSFYINLRCSLTLFKSEEF